jgi:hypothetical protein
MKKIICSSILTFAALNAAADDYSPYIGEDYPLNLYWGDTHLHTSFSLDANTMGNTSLPPSSAYRFAMGEEVIANNGMAAKLEAPLDFLVVSDHAEHMGIMLKLREEDPQLLEDPDGRRLFSILNGENGSQNLMMELLHSTASNTPMIDNKDIERSVWQESINLADKFNKPGQFTALIGYEWSSMPASDNLHRVVIFADDAEKVGQVLPFSSFHSEEPEQLWQYLGNYERETGGRAMAIPHNGNISNGRMYALTDSSGNAFSESYAQARIRWEPLMEVTQIKGDSETHPYLSPDDDFANFETWDFGNFGAMQGDNKKPEMLEFEYARSSLKNGLVEQQRTGVNPFKFGMIGSTDSHTSLATAQENNFWGKASMVEPGSARTAEADDIMGGEGASHTMFFPWEYVASGYAAVWARENTRAEIFDAMQRKEVYATTGSRIAVRFFGGWEFQEDDIFDPDYARIGYRKGVPMGGDLAEQSSQAPTFLVMALKDPNGANLERVQIIKGWRDKRGVLHEQVHDVALGKHLNEGGRRFRKMTSTVDERSASYSNSIGDAQLSAHWQDPDFNANEHAFYYARVIEIPTPRWPAYDRARLGVKVSSDAQLTVQDRAYTSPIWYTP